MPIKIPMSEFLFKKVAGLKACNFIKKRLQHKCFSVKFVKFQRTPILKNIFERLLLIIYMPNDNLHVGRFLLSILFF